jgi:hypothetical protein
VELHRNDKIKIVVVLVILVGLVFDPFLVLGLVILGGFIGLILWMAYKGIRQNIENLFVPGATAKAQNASNMRYKKRTAQMKAKYGLRPVNRISFHGGRAWHHGRRF